MRRFSLMLVATLILTLFTSCSKQTAESNLSVEAKQFILLGDRSDAIRERVYIFSESEIFIADHIFPGYTDRKYFVADYSGFQVVGDWDQFDELNGPFLPGGPTGYCVIYNDSGSVQKDMNFDAIEGKASSLMKEIDQMTRKISLQASEIPNWIKQHPELLRFVQ